MARWVHRIHGSLAGALIGRKGSRVTELREKSGANISLLPVMDDVDAKEVCITGSRAEVELAVQLVIGVLELEPDSCSHITAFPIPNSAKPAPEAAPFLPGEDESHFAIPTDCVPRVIGPRGSIIKGISSQSGCYRIHICDDERDGPVTSVTIRGPAANRARAIEMIKDVVKREPLEAGRDRRAEHSGQLQHLGSRIGARQGRVAGERDPEAHSAGPESEKEYARARFAEDRQFAIRPSTTAVAAMQRSRTASGGGNAQLEHHEGQPLIAAGGRPPIVMPPSVAHPTGLSAIGAPGVDTELAGAEGSLIFAMQQQQRAKSTYEARMAKLRTEEEEETAMVAELAAALHAARLRVAERQSAAEGLAKEWIAQEQLLAARVTQAEAALLEERTRIAEARVRDAWLGASAGTPLDAVQW